MEFIEATILSEKWKPEILGLWNNEYPQKLNYTSLQDFESYLERLTDQSHVLLLNENKEIEGWYFDFVREKERWFAIILSSKIQGHGFGTKVLDHAKIKESELNGWVLENSTEIKRNGEFYKSPIDFYLKNGFKRLSHKRLELDSLSAVKIKWNK